MVAGKGMRSKERFVLSLVLDGAVERLNYTVRHNQEWCLGQDVMHGEGGYC